ncbi:hypothetical protein Tco_0029080 [Tanacetum coccineum]
MLHYLTAYNLPSPSNSHCPLIPELPSVIIILVPWRTCSGSPSSSEPNSDGGVIGLAISLPLYLVDALDLVEDACFNGGDIFKIVSTVVHSRTFGESSVAGTAGIVTVVSLYGPSTMHFLKALPFGLVSM